MNKAILITGCSSGIGLAAANYLRQQGFRVIAACRKVDDINRLKEQGFDTVQLDLDDSESVEQAAKDVLALTNNRLYALFNNAGFGTYGKLQTISRKQLEDQFSTNFFGLHQLTLLLLPSMIEQGEGRIIQTSSVMGIISTPGRGAYAASKYAVEAWSDALRLELYGTGVEVSLIEPGPIQTKFTSNVHQTDSQTKVTNPAMIKRFALGPEAILPKLHHALTSPHPKLRYPVTLVTYAAGILKRLLPGFLLDKILRQQK